MSQTPSPVRIPRAIFDEVIAHAREEAPNEACGLIGGIDDRAQTVYRARNAEASPLRYNLDPKDQFRIMSEIEERGEELAAIYHSHTASPAYPSQTDINLALMDRREDGKIVGQEPLFPGVVFRIDEVGVTEVELAVE